MKTKQISILSQQVQQVIVYLSIESTLPCRRYLICFWAVHIHDSTKKIKSSNVQNICEDVCVSKHLLWRIENSGLYSYLFQACCKFKTKSHRCKLSWLRYCDFFRSCTITMEFYCEKRHVHCYDVSSCDYWSRWKWFAVLYCALLTPVFLFFAID